MMQLNVKEYIPNWMDIKEEGKSLHIYSKKGKGRSNLVINKKIDADKNFWFQLGVYASEGYRPRTSDTKNFSSFDVCNSDKKIISNMIEFLNKFGIGKEKIRGFLHIKIGKNENNSNLTKVFKKEWSIITGIPEDKISTNVSFYKKAKPLNKEFIGIFHVRFGNVIFMHILRNILLSQGLEWR